MRVRFVACAFVSWFGTASVAVVLSGILQRRMLYTPWRRVKVVFIFDQE
jgi:hypothetical protein